MEKLEAELTDYTDTPLNELTTEDASEIIDDLKSDLEFLGLLDE